MHLVCLGLNHRSASLHVREAFAVARDDVGPFLRNLCESPRVSEAFVISTCNRIEVYAVGDVTTSSDEVLGAVREALLSWHKASIGRNGDEKSREFKAFDESIGAYHYAGREAVRHLFSVTSSLDSMVVGEPQILGQVKDAWRAAQEAGTTGTFLHRCVERAFRTAKRTRNETGIAKGAVSVSYVAVQLARRVFEDFARCNVLVLGAGEMAELTALHLHENGARKVTVVNRNEERARELAAKYGWEHGALSQLREQLVGADIVVSSTGSPLPVMDGELVQDVLSRRHYRPLFLIDIAVPRDVDAVVGTLDGVYLYNVDDLEELASRNREERSEEVVSARNLVAEEVAAFGRWLAVSTVAPTVAALKQRLMELRGDELERSRRLLEELQPEQREGVERMLQSLISKVLHGPATALKASAESGSAEYLVKSIREAFGLAELGVLEGEDAEATSPADTAGSGGRYPRTEPSLDGESDALEAEQETA